MPHVTLFEELSREEGLQEGREVGLQEGREVGLQEGRQEGLQEGREVGLQEGRQRSILDLLETRFGEVPKAIRDGVRAIHDEARLKEMLCRAAVIPSLEEF